ncbi:UNVERIFIED_CONTAM: hypothetical protein FKN15_061427 [Acipenser sinensis]
MCNLPTVEKKKCVLSLAFVALFRTNSASAQTLIESNSFHLVWFHWKCRALFTQPSGLFQALFC